MDRKPFVNEAFTYAINEYLENKNNVEGVKFNSFFVIILRLIMLIYDELDILNPYNFENENTLYINLTKYGYEQCDVIKFMNLLNIYYDNQTEENFIIIQKMVIDMFIKKKSMMKISDEDKNTFRNLLYSPYSSVTLNVSYNFLMSSNPTDVINYYDLKINEEVKKTVDKPKETLNLEAYEILKYSMQDIKDMSSDELDNVNHEVYDYFKINANAINKKYLLDKAVYDLNNPKPSFSTGNGYVDILFFLAITATIGLLIFVATVIFL